MVHDRTDNRWWPLSGWDFAWLLSCVLAGVLWAVMSMADGQRATFFTHDHPCPADLVIGHPLPAHDPDGGFHVLLFMVAPAMLAEAPRMPDVPRLMLGYWRGEPYGGRPDYAGDAANELGRGGIVGLVFACTEDADRARAGLLREIEEATWR